MTVLCPYCHGMKMTTSWTRVAFSSIDLVRSQDTYDFRDFLKSTNNYTKFKINYAKLKNEPKKRPDRYRKISNPPQQLVVLDNEQVVASLLGFALSFLQIHHRLRFCCDSFFSWILLKSFRHRFKTIGGSEVADVEQTKDGSTHHVRNFPLSVCLRVGFGVDVFWFGSWGPNWFYQATNQEQLCGSWKHVSLQGFFPWWSSWSLLRCLLRYAT